MVNNRYFLLSGFIAVSFYILLALLLVVYLQERKVKKIDAMTKHTVLQLDVMLDTPVEPKKTLDIKSEVQNKKIAKEVVKKTSSKSVKQRSDLKSLFANVKTSAKKVAKKKVSTVKKSSISSRFKSKFEKQRKVKDVVLNDLVNKQSNMKKVVLSESKNETDPYFSKIYQMLSSRWTPTIFSENLKAKVIVSIGSNGSFSFKFIQYSGDSSFDNQLQQFLNNESLKKYPINPNNKQTNIEILFQSKG